MLATSNTRNLESSHNWNEANNRFPRTSLKDVLEASEREHEVQVLKVSVSIAAVGALRLTVSYASRVGESPQQPFAMMN